MSCKEKIDNEVTYPDIPTPALPKHNVSNQNSNKYSYESEKKVLGPLPMEQTIVAANNQSDFRNHLSNTSSTLLKSEPAKCIDSLQTNSHVKKQVYTVLSSKYALYSPQLSPEISIHDNGGMFSQDTQQEIVPAKPPARVPMKKQVSFSDELVYIHEYDDRIAYKPEYNEFYKEIKANTLPTRNTYEEREQYSTWIKHKPYHPSPHAPHPPQRLSSKLLNVFQPTKVLSQEKITNKLMN
ncbi:hypothetical protein BDB01DRAFT_605405 [Pilobolus umbonatus]|nr:hypothetical protein BDB01DRAFT_605405 [Pilobolus umbonatus]